ncbi:MAG: preprotein translocase subunit SecE [Reinekea sp.]|jgi:preprotein translocase subunit SecE
MNAQASPSNSVFDYVKWFVVVALIVAAVGGNYYFSTESLIVRFVGVLVVLVAAGALALTTRKGKDVNRLRKEAWVEVRKVVWPTRQETLQTTLIVVAFVLVVAFILFFIDMLLSWVVSQIIG